MTRRRTLRSFILAALCLVAIVGAPFSVAAPVGAGSCRVEPRLFDEATASEQLTTDRPFAPANRDLFMDLENPAWADAAPVQFPEGPAPTEHDVRDELRSFLERRFPCSLQSVHFGIQLYDHPLTRQKIPEPNLRAAMLALTGTIGEPAIEYLLFGAPVVAVQFGVVIHYGDELPLNALAAVYELPDGTWTIVIDGLLRFNPFQTLSALLFHEALHIESQPGEVGLPEETAASALEALVYMQMLLTDPAIAKFPDQLTRGANNHAALLRLNSGVAGTDRLNLFVPDGVANIDPVGIEPMLEFAEYYARYGGATSDAEWRVRETPGTPLLEAVLAKLADPGETPPAKPAFDRATLEFIDRNQAGLSPGQLMTVACILELDVPCG